MMDGDLGLDAVAMFLLGLVAASLLGAIISAVVFSRLGRHRLGCGSLVMSWVLMVSGGVVAVVLWRVKDGEATLYDCLWAVGFGTLAVVISRRLVQQGGPPAATSA